MKFKSTLYSLSALLIASSYADSGLYVGLGAGYGSIYTNTTNGYTYLDGSSSKNGGNMAGGLYVGYDFNRYLGLQFDYDYIANIQYSSSSVNGINGSFNANQQILDLGITGHLPFDIFTNNLSGLSLFAKLAVGYTTTSFSGGYLDSSGQSLAGIQAMPTFAQSVVPVIGVGVEYGIDSVGARLEYDYIGNTNVTNNGVNMMNLSNDLILLSVMYHF